MKYLNMLFMGIAFIVMLSSCGRAVDVKPEDRILMVNDKLYYGTNETGPMGARAASVEKIISTVKSDEIPNKNGQSNFGEVGAAYTNDSDLGFIMVQIDAEWYVFYSEAPEYPTNDPTENGVASVTEQVQTEQTEPELPPESSIAEAEKVPELSSSGARAQALPQSGGTIAESINITVLPISMVAEHEAFSVTGHDAQKQMIAYLEQMKPCNPDPHTGGYLFEISISRNGKTEKYNLLSATDSSGNSYVTQDGQWYTAAHDLWLFVAAYYPKFDYENNQPKYVIGITMKRNGMSFAYYDDKTLAWSETEQERCEKILAFLYEMEPYDGNRDNADKMTNAIEISLADFKNDIYRLYYCYDLYDNDGKCIVEFAGRRKLSADDALETYRNGGWFIADEAFYQYLSSFF